MQQFSNALADLVAAGGRSVVRVESRRRLHASGVVWSQDGVIITADHVLKREDNLSVGLPDGKTVGTTVVGRDPSTDLAVLRVSDTSLMPLTIGNGTSLRVGMIALALARPGRTVQASMGIVSALGEQWRTPLGGLIDPYVRTEISMYPGFSGGALIDTAGQLLALNTSALSRHANVAIPAATIQRVVQEVLTHGRVRRGYLGIGAQPVALPASLQQQLQQESGLLLSSVAAGSAAEQHGLLLGDVIVAVEGQPIRHLDELMSQLGGDRIGAEVAVRVVRSGQLLDLKVVVGEHA